MIMKLVSGFRELAVASAIVVGIVYGLLVLLKLAAYGKILYLT